MRKITQDDCMAFDPFMHVKDTGGSNGADDVKFERILKTERFTHLIEGSNIFPEKYRRIQVIERLFIDNYGNFFLSWLTQIADGTICNPYHCIGLNETTYDSRRYPDDEVPWETLELRDDVFLRFRHSANEQVFKAQRRALANFKPIRKKIETNFDGEPVNMLG